MPLLGFLHIAVAIYFAVHAVRTGRPMYWLFILLAFPFLGSVVYFFAEFMGEARNSAGARRAMRLMQGVVDPSRELREARAEFDRTPTAYNEANLARTLLAHGDTAQAVQHYEHCVSGPYANDPSFLKGLAIAYLEAQRPNDAVRSLERLFETQPQQRAGDLALLYAESLASAKRPEAADAFDALVALDNSMEARTKYGVYLASVGRHEQARQQFEGVLADGLRVSKHARELNHEWLALSKQNLQGSSK